MSLCDTRVAILYRLGYWWSLKPPTPREHPEHPGSLLVTEAAFGEGGKKQSMTKTSPRRVGGIFNPSTMAKGSIWTVSGILTLVLP